MRKNISRQHKRQHRYTPYTFKKEYLEFTAVSSKISKPCLFSYCQACSILKAIELNDRKKLSKKCIAQLAVFVSRAWEDNPSQGTIHQVYYMINNLLDTTSMDVNKPFEIALQEYCSSSVSTPSICPSITLLVAISYIERLNKRYKDLKGTTGCSFRMIMVAFIMASKYIHDTLQLIIYTNSRKNNHTAAAAALLSSSSKKVFYSSQAQSIDYLLNRMQRFNDDYVPTTVIAGSINTETLSSSSVISTTSSNDTLLLPKKEEGEMTSTERNTRIARMELEFLHFLNYDLSVEDPVMLVKWAQGYEDEKNDNNKKPLSEPNYEADDEMDDEMDDS